MQLLLPQLISNDIKWLVTGHHKICLIEIMVSSNARQTYQFHIQTWNFLFGQSNDDSKWVSECGTARRQLGRTALYLCGPSVSGPIESYTKRTWNTKYVRRRRTDDARQRSNHLELYLCGCDATFIPLCGKEAKWQKRNLISFC